ncbi:NAD-dependent epimerase [Desulfovibrio sp. OttesenSCG-928-F07]|nr:NAD-dependent epimerase [Desulfovibrio sp. OttesenSCG-928-F07]
MKVLVTGGAGFIGFFLSKKLLENGHTVYGIDNLNDYYSPALKKDRIAQLKTNPAYSFTELDIANAEALNTLFKEQGFTHVVNLAAQAGVRYSIINPAAYVQSNLVGFANVLEACRNYPVEHLVYASSSSVYGMNGKMPFSTAHEVNHPVSLYAASKKSGELMTHSYSHLYNIPTTGLRFFTVYGPWGRPDMAYFSFTKRILAGEPIQLFNNGKMLRDFTYIDDIIAGVYACLLAPAAPDKNWDSKAPCPASSFAPYRVYNIGNNNAVELEYFVNVLEDSLGVKAVKEYLPMQAGDVYATYANIDDMHNTFGFTPATSIEEGLPKFAKWYKEYFKA